MRSLSIIVPAFNEEQRLPETLQRISSFVGESAYASIEVIVVDDGSSDGTAAVVRAYAASDVRFRLLQNPGNQGKGYAVRNGMLAATGEWRLMTDADLSTPIDEIQKLYAHVVSTQASVAIGSRALDRTLIVQHQSMFREFGGRFFNLIMRGFTGLPFRDTQCGFKLYRADAADAIFSRQVLNGFSFDVEDVYLAQKLGFKVVEVPVRWANAEGTKVTLRSTLRAFADLVRIRWFAISGRYSRTRSQYGPNGAR